MKRLPVRTARSLVEGCAQQRQSQRTRNTCSKREKNFVSGTVHEHRPHSITISQLSDKDSLSGRFRIRLWMWKRARYALVSYPEYDPERALFWWAL